MAWDAGTGQGPGHRVGVEAGGAAFPAQQVKGQRRIPGLGKSAGNVPDVRGQPAVLVAALDAQLQQDAGISHFEYMVLAGLSEAPARTPRMSDLAGFTESGLPRLSQVVSRLEKRGWVHRPTDPSDGRITLATLTDEGWAKVIQTAPGHVEAVRALVFDPLTKAQSRQLGSIGKRIMGVIDPEESRPHSVDHV
ncbi:UNVERIFIED_ORG: DNA-binding MarR family transcriptional regulator [Arthrobacter sp. UYEF2]